MYANIIDIQYLFIIFSQSGIIWFITNSCSCFIWLCDLFKYSSTKKSTSRKSGKSWRTSNPSGYFTMCIIYDLTGWWSFFFSKKIIKKQRFFFVDSLYCMESLFNHHSWWNTITISCWSGNIINSFVTFSLLFQLCFNILYQSCSFSTYSSISSILSILTHLSTCTHRQSCHSNNKYGFQITQSNTKNGCAYNQYLIIEYFYSMEKSDTVCTCKYCINRIFHSQINKRQVQKRTIKSQVKKSCPNRMYLKFRQEG